MDAVIPWLTPAVVIAVGAWLRAPTSAAGWTVMEKRIDNAVRELRTDIAGVNARIDAVLLTDRDRNRQDRGAA